MGTYYQRDVASDLQGVFLPQAGSLAEIKSLAATTGTANTLVLSVAASAGLDTRASFVAPSTDPGVLNWPSGSHVVQWDVTAAGSSIAYSARWYRVAADGSASYWQDAILATNTGTGLKQVTSTSTSWNANGSRASTDRFDVEVLASNSNMMAVESLTIRVNTTDSYVTVPWTVSSGPQDHTFSPTAEPVGLTDSVAVVRTSLRTATDTLGLTDSITALLSRESAVTDALGILDIAAIAQDAVRSPAAALGLADDLTVDHQMASGETFERTVFSRVPITLVTT